MLDYASPTLRTAGYRPYYLYRQKYMSGSLENVGWARPGTESLYNIVMMEELHTVISLGAGGVTKLIDPQSGRLLRLSNPKYPQDYLSAGEKLAEQQREMLAFSADHLYRWAACPRERSSKWLINCRRSTGAFRLT